jgi:hypothetical protein
MTDDAKRIPAEQIDEAWLDEAKRRREEVRSGQAQLVPWRVVRGEMFEMIERARLDHQPKIGSERRVTGASVDQASSRSSNTPKS